MLELIVNSEQNKKNIMLVENGVLIEKHEENDTHKRIEGNIYCGIVQSVLEGMQAAFINIGDEKNTFIRAKDAALKQDESKITDIEKNNINIKNILKEKSKVLIQVKRDGTQKKGARVSTHINLPGRFIVFLPNSNFVTASQKIEDEKRKNDLINLVKERLPENTGAIIRTSAFKADDNKILEDLNNLLVEWKRNRIKI